MDFLKQIIAFLKSALTGPWRTLMTERRPLIWLLALIIGIATAYAIWLFRMLINFTQYVWTGSELPKTMTSITSTLPWWQIMAGPAMAGLLAGYAYSL
ncbi:MAG: hypothetical protein V6Z81_03110 [Parvularculales bacterium]